MLRTKRGRPSWVPSPLGREMCPRTNLQCGPRGGGPVVKGTQRTDNGQVSRLGQPQLGLGLRLHFTGGGHPQTASISPVPALDSWTKPGHTDPPLQAWGGPPQELRAAPGPAALTEKVVLVTSMLLCEMPPLRLPGMPPLCCFFWLLTMVSMEWLRTRMALCGEK